MDIVFQSHPDVVLGSNTFRGCPTILQFEDTALIEVGRFEGAGFTTRFTIFHNDGTPIGEIKGSRIFLTDKGKKAKLTLSQEAQLTVCELENKPIFELRRIEAQALKGWAELYTPDGAFIKVRDAQILARLHGSQELILPGGVVMIGNTISGFKIGIQVKRTGIAVGVNC